MQLIRKVFSHSSGTCIIAREFVSSTNYLQAGGNCSAATGACACKCHKCGNQLGKCTLFCPACSIIQRIDSKSCNPFELFGFSTSYEIPPDSVDAAFKKLQWQLHPDKFSLKSTEEQHTSTHNSSVVNEGYSALKSPLMRAQALLQHHGINALDQKEAHNHPSLMMEIFSLREEIDELSNETERKTMLEKLEQRKTQIEHELVELFKHRKFHDASQKVLNLQYIVKVMEELDKRIN